MLLGASLHDRCEATHFAATFFALFLPAAVCAHVLLDVVGGMLSQRHRCWLQCLLSMSQRSEPLVLSVSLIAIV